ncbi:DUF3649 domain-containing protein [Sphingobium phenoxybenzoativorans]|uniref:DUF3649 domain-containing protein n=1 Tax=Sphingobium phenoxybenzoativorans TaxID=1592790 RepID=UPI0009F708AE|nr:DUF3649 domain-containing protein [Sphingobium phenoxybenzoativorans]
MKNLNPHALRYRLSVASRVVAAALGGYALAAAISMALARALPMSRAEAVTTATILAVLAMPAAAIWVFAARTAWLAWAGVSAVTMCAAAIAWLLGVPA